MRCIQRIRRSKFETIYARSIIMILCLCTYIREWLVATPLAKGEGKRDKTYTYICHKFTTFE